MIHTGRKDHVIYVHNLCSPAIDLQWYFFWKEVSFFLVQLILLVLSWLANWFCQFLAPACKTLWVGFQNSSGQRGQLPNCRLYEWGTEGLCLDLFQSEKSLLGIIQLWYPNWNQLFLPSFLPFLWFNAKFYLGSILMAPKNNLSTFTRTQGGHSVITQIKFMAWSDWMKWHHIVGSMFSP
jgi:hypothetical protein